MYSDSQRPSCATQQQDVGAVSRLRPSMTSEKPTGDLCRRQRQRAQCLHFYFSRRCARDRKSGFNLALRRDLLDFGGLLWNIQAKNKTTEKKKKKKCLGGCEKLILTNIHSMSCVILDEIWAATAQRGQWQRPPTSGSDVNHPGSSMFSCIYGTAESLEVKGNTDHWSLTRPQSFWRSKGHVAGGNGCHISHERKHSTEGRGKKKSPAPSVKVRRGSRDDPNPRRH